MAARGRGGAAVLALLLALAGRFPVPPARAGEVLFARWNWGQAEQKRIDAAAKKLSRGPDGFWSIRHDKGEFRNRPLEVRTGVSARFTAEVNEYTLLFLRRFVDVFPVSLDRKPHELRVVVHGDRAAYLQATGVPAWTGGIQISETDPGDPRFLRMSIHTYLREAGGSGATRAARSLGCDILQHEGTHALLQAIVGAGTEIPVFVNEACASFFENWDLRFNMPGAKGRNDEGRRLPARSDVSRYWRLAEQLDAFPDWRPRLGGLLALSRAEWNAGTETDIALRYALAEVWADFMLTDTGRRAQFKGLIEALAGRDGKAAGAWADPKSVAAWEPAWHDFLRRTARSVKTRASFRRYTIFDK